MVNAIKIVLQVIGLATVVWFIWVAVEEYKKIQQEERDKNGQSPG